MNLVLNLKEVRLNTDILGRLSKSSIVIHFQVNVIYLLTLVSIGSSTRTRSYLLGIYPVLQKFDS